MKRIQSKLHKIGTYEVFKIYRFCFDDNRFGLFHKDILRE